MLEEGERYIFTTGKPSVIRSALSVILSGVKSEEGLTPDSRERLEAFASGLCDWLILDLRTAKELPSSISPTVRNLRVSHAGQVLIVTGEVTKPGILRKIAAIHRAHRFPAHLASGLRSFVHMLF